MDIATTLPVGNRTILSRSQTQTYTLIYITELVLVQFFFVVGDNTYIVLLPLSKFVEESKVDDKHSLYSAHMELVSYFIFAAELRDSSFFLEVRGENMVSRSTPTPLLPV